VNPTGDFRYWSKSRLRAEVPLRASLTIGSAKPFDLRHAATLSVNAQLRYRSRRLGGVIREIPVE
jgi:hypothetical protein